ncbi:MAG: hypothetical protein R6V02_05810 [Candidatus Aminicenantes bacterium]
MKKIRSPVYLLAVLVLLSGVLGAFPADQEQVPYETLELQLEEDVITESDGTGGALTTNDILLIILIVLAVIGLGALL